MRVRDIMSSRPIVVGERTSDIKRLMEIGHVNHVPVVEGGRLVGIWIATERGTLLMLGPEQVYETRPGVDAADALEALVDGAEAVLVWDSGVPAGVLTRTDLLSVVRTAVRKGIGRRHPRPVVVRIAGPAQAGKTTLLMRTLGLLARIDVALIQGNAQAPGDVAPLAGARALDEPDADKRTGLQRAVDKLADAQLILVEDRDGPHDSMGDIGEDVRVAIVPAGELGAVTPERLEGVEALVATRADEVGELDVEDGLRGLRKTCHGLHTFAVAAGHDDRGLDAWARWLEGQAFRQRD